jgi:hypothetical protein
METKYENGQNEEPELQLFFTHSVTRHDSDSQTVTLLHMMTPAEHVTFFIDITPTSATP